MKQMQIYVTLIVTWLGTTNLQAKADDAQSVKVRPVLLYYRVAESQTKQVKSTHIKEVKAFLRGLRLSFVCGHSYHDNARGGSRVPVAIHESGWQSCLAKNEAQRKRLIATMAALGIETSIVRPDENDD